MGVLILRLTVAHIHISSFSPPWRRHPQIINTDGLLRLPRFNTLRFLSESISLLFHTLARLLFLYDLPEFV